MVQLRLAATVSTCSDFLFEFVATKAVQGCLMSDVKFLQSLKNANLLLPRHSNYKELDVKYSTVAIID